MLAWDVYIYKHFSLPFPVLIRPPSDVNTGGQPVPPDPELRVTQGVNQGPCLECAGSKQGLSLPHVRV